MMNSKPIPQPGILPPYPTLSICMIVRDEEKTLRRCLESVRDAADELIVVDTGSQDGTVNIAREFGAKLYHFTWCDDFSAARNESLKYASGDWILQIDGDEELLPASIQPLKECMTNPWCVLYTITVDNGPHYPDRFFHPGRLFRNHPKLRYARPYHETLRDSERILRNEAPRWKIEHRPEIVVRHHGYGASYMKEKEKYAREISVLESYVKENPKDRDMAVRLAEVLSCVEQYDEAIGICRQVLATHPDFARAHHALGAAYWKKEQFAEAVLEYRKTLQLDPAFGFAHYRLGAAYCTQGLFDEARRELQQALEMDPHFALAHCWLGITYCKSGLIDAGLAEFKEAINIDPGLALGHYWLGAASNLKGLYREAIASFNRAQAIDPGVDTRLNLNLSTAHFNLGAVLHSKGLLDEAISEYEKSLKLNPGDMQVRHHLHVARETKVAG